MLFRSREDVVNNFDKAHLAIRLKGQGKNKVSTKSITIQDIISRNIA